MDKLLRIGELSKLCDVSIKTLRFYEELGLITPKYVDSFTGYRHYDEQNVLDVYKIKFLKNVGFSLEEIRAFDKAAFEEKTKEIKQEIAKLNDKLKQISFYKNIKGDVIMKPFINDEDAIGKWKYIASCQNKEEFLKGGSYFDDKIFLKDLYFLPEGKGYWIFERWTKGTIYHFRNIVYNYEILNNKLFLNICNENNEVEITLVFEKETSKKYKIEDIMHLDNIDIAYVSDNEILGSWKVYDYISLDKKNNYNGQRNSKNEFLFDELNFMDLGKCFVKYNDKQIRQIKYTLGKVIDDMLKTVSEYIIKEIDGEKFLIIDWKSRDYTYAGRVSGCHVFKKMPTKI